MAQWFVTNISVQNLYNICINMADSSESFEGNEFSSPYIAFLLNCCALWTYHDKFLYANNNKRGNVCINVTWRHVRVSFVEQQ